MCDHGGRLRQCCEMYKCMNIFVSTIKSANEYCASSCTTFIYNLHIHTDIRNYHLIITNDLLPSSLVASVGGCVFDSCQDGRFLCFVGSPISILELLLSIKFKGSL